MKCNRILAAYSLCLLCAPLHADWPRWRGPLDNGTPAAATALPAKVDASRVLWKASLPGKGSSTPIVWNKKIYVTAPVGGKDALLAFDWSGRPLWQTTFGEEDRGRHRNGSGCNPSPVTDGTSIFVTFKSGSLAAVNPDGTIRWQTNLVKTFGPVKLFWDFGTSPVLTEKDVIIARMHAGESWLAAFDKQTGRMRWKTARNYEVPREIDNGYTTPQVVRHAGREALLTWGAEHLTLHDAANGRLLWSCGNFNPGENSLWPAVASPLVVGDVAVVCFGRADKGQPRLHGVKLGGAGDVTKTHRLWMREDAGAFVPTPAEYQGDVYVLSDRGQVDCLDPKTGKTRWSHALPRSSSNYYASPLIANGTLYAAREDGALFVAHVHDGFKLLSETKFADRIIASLVPAENRLFIRGESHLYCVGGE
jgi:outer membrane protein assembly factor BamB